MSSNFTVQAYNSFSNLRFPSLDFSTISSLVKKTDWVFGLSLATLVGLSVSELRKAYLYWQEDPSQLPNHFKSVRVEVLFEDIDTQLKANNSNAAKLLLKKCEALRASDPEKISLVRLIRYYAKVDLNHAYQLAQDLSSCGELLSAATIFKEKNAFDEALALLAKLLEPQNLLDQTHYQSGLDLSLKLFKNLYQQIDASPSKCREAITLALQFQWQGSTFQSQILGLCKIICACHEVGDKNRCDDFQMEIETKLVDPDAEAISNSDLLHTYLIQAECFFDINDYVKMDDKLRKFRELFKKTEDSCKTEVALPFAQLVKKITSNNGSLKSECLSLKSLIINEAKAMLKKAADPSQTELTDHQKIIQAYLHSATIFKVLEENDLVEQAFGEALSQMQALLDQIEVQKTFNSKNCELQLGLLSDILEFYKKLPNQTHAEAIKLSAQHLLRQIDSLPDETGQALKTKLQKLVGFVLRCKKLCIELKVPQLLTECYENSKSIEDRFLRHDCVNLIFQTYEHLKLEEDLVDFLKMYVQDIKSDKEDINDKLGPLLYNSCPTKYRELLLKAAEELLPQVPSYLYTRLGSAIAECYLKVNPQKSREIYYNYITWSTIRHVFMTALGSFATWLGYAYPSTALSSVMVAIIYTYRTTRSH